MTPATPPWIADLPDVQGDPVQLRLLFDNLVSNAVKYRSSERAFDLQIEAAHRHDRVEVLVDDAGIGIPSEHRERVLRLFQRLHTRDEVAGTGVGLTLAHRIVERHGGVLAIEDSPLGGIRVRFDLPAASATAAGADVANRATESAHD